MDELQRKNAAVRKLSECGFCSVLQYKDREETEADGDKDEDEHVHPPAQTAPVYLLAVRSNDARRREAFKPYYI